MNRVGSSEDKTHKELYEIFVHHDYLSEVDMKEDFIDTLNKQNESTMEVSKDEL